MNSISTPSQRTTQSGFFSYLSLFTSVGTLLCCALPSLLVLLGLGATVASALSFMPFLVTLSHHKKWVFLISGTLISLSFVQVYALSPRMKDRACPPHDPEACRRATRASVVLLWISALLYAIGFSVVYIVGPILARIDS